MIAEYPHDGCVFVTPVTREGTVPDPVVNPHVGWGVYLGDGSRHPYVVNKRRRAAQRWAETKWPEIRRWIKITGPRAVYAASTERGSG